MNEQLEEFERKIKENLGKETNSLEDFTKQIKEGTPKNLPPNQQQIVINKNLIIAFHSDATGCGHIRTIFPFTYLNSIFAPSGSMNIMMSPIFIFQDNMLAMAKTLYFQRQMTPEHLNIIKTYKQHQPRFQYKMVWEMDDFVWGYNEEQGGSVEDGVPSYNFGAQHITPAIKAASVEIMNMMDEITVSTLGLKNYMQNILKVNTKITVIPNTVPLYFWGTTKKSPITEDLVKPRVIYTGSPTHYLNPVPSRPPSKEEPLGFPGKEPKLGDFQSAWKDWIIKNVKEDKITFIVMGGLPWFFEEIKDKITIVNWIDSFRYHLLVKDQKADIGIMPLVPNNFNRCKSDIKYIEHIADGIVAIGTTFEDGTMSPYDDCILKVSNNCTIEDIDEIFWNACKKENYNRIVEQQYNDFINKGRYLESPQNINGLTEVLFK